MPNGRKSSFFPTTGRNSIRSEEQKRRECTCSMPRSTSRRTSLTAKGTMKYFRYVIPKGISLDGYAQEDIDDMIFSNVNSYFRNGLEWKSLLKHRKTKVKSLTICAKEGFSMCYNRPIDICAFTMKSDYGLVER